MLNVKNCPHIAHTKVRLEGKILLEHFQVIFSLDHFVKCLRKSRLLEPLHLDWSFRNLKVGPLSLFKFDLLSILRSQWALTTSCRDL